MESGLLCLTALLCDCVDVTSLECSPIGLQMLLMTLCACEILKCHVGSRYRMLHLDDSIPFITIQSKVGPDIWHVLENTHVHGKENTIL